MPVDMNALAADLAAETDGLRAIVGPLSPEQWLTPTPAPDWTIADQIVHLAFFDEQATIAATDPDRFRQSLSEMASDPSGFADKVNARHRDFAGPQALAWFDQARSNMISALAKVDPSARVPWYGPDMSVASSLTARIMETWAHGQDVADALNVDRPLSPALRHVAHIGARAFANSFTAHGQPVPETPVRVELTGPDGDVWTWGPQDVTDKVSGPALDFCLVVTQRRHLDDTGLVITGPVATAWMNVAQAFAGPPGPKRQPGQFAKKTT
jgi:uncharacterized protein (TIGR03084 family)